MGEQKQAGSLVKVLAMQAWWCHGITSFPKTAFWILYVYCGTHHTHALGRHICNSSMLCKEIGSQDNSQNPTDPLSNVPSLKVSTFWQGSTPKVIFWPPLVPHSTSVATLKHYKRNVCTALVDGRRYSIQSSRQTVGQSQLNVSFIRAPVVMVDLHCNRNPKTARCSVGKSLLPNLISWVSIFDTQILGENRLM